MRGKRGEDLIWNGSTEIGRSNRAGVKLVFDNSKNLFSLDFEEVIIERVVNRDGNNEYYLNGSLVRLKDIIELLSQAHIGASGHHIISQGEADRILSANIKERKEMIEDALGLKIYQYKREESERKLLKTEENIKQVESLRREIAPHIKFLKKQAEKVEKAEELRVKLSKFYREYLKREQVYIESQNNSIKKEKEPIVGQLKDLNKKMEEAKEILIASESKDQKSEELLNTENEIKKERENKDNLYREVGKIEGEINVNKRNIEKIETDQRSEENKTIPLKEVEELEKEVSTYLEITKIIEKIRNFIISHRSKLDNKHLDRLNEENDSLIKIKVELEDKIMKVEESLSELSSKYQKIKESIEKEKDSSREAEKTMFKISGEQSNLRNRLNILEMETRRVSSLEEDWKREIKEGGVLLGTAILGFENDEIPNLEEVPASAESYGVAREEKRRELEKMKIRLEELGGGEGVEVMKEYKDSIERDEFLLKELEDLKNSAKSLEQLIKELLLKLDVEFKQGIEKINKSFHEFFSLMFGGGEAKLEIVKSKKVRKYENLEMDEDGESIRTNKSSMLDALDLPSFEDGDFGEAMGGIDISVSLPRKRTKGLEMLSGGERALTSIALLFAVSAVTPPPFIILDETDAALDEANSKKYGDMIESLSKVSQLILITHNRETMSRAGVIYGVTMGRDGVSRLLSIAFDEAVAVAK